MTFSNTPNIETNRLQLHKIEKHHVDIVFNLRSNKIVCKYIARPLCKDREEAQLHIDKVTSQLKSDISITWVIDLKKDKVSIGTICLWNFSEDRKKAEVGYDLMPEFHHKGIMSEALQAVVDFGFKTLQLNTIEAYTSYKNKNSIGLLEKQGFKLQEELRDEGFPNNRIYSISLQ